MGSAAIYQSADFRVRIIGSAGKVAGTTYGCSLLSPAELVALILLSCVFRSVLRRKLPRFDSESLRLFFCSSRRAQRILVELVDDDVVACCPTLQVIANYQAIGSHLYPLLAQ